MCIEIELQNLRNDLNTALKQQTESRVILDNLDKEQLDVSYSNSVVKLKNLNFKKIKHSNINKIFFEQINLPRNLNRIQLDAFSRLKLLDETIHIIKQKITVLEQQLKGAH